MDNQTANLVGAMNTELDALRRDAERYRVVRELWVRIEERSTYCRADGLDEWCDEQRAKETRK